MLAYMAWTISLCVRVCISPQTLVQRCPCNCRSCSVHIFCKRGSCAARSASGLTLCEMFDSSSVSRPFPGRLSVFFCHSCIWPCRSCWMFYYSSSATCRKVINDYQGEQRRYRFKVSQGQLASSLALSQINDLFFVNYLCKFVLWFLCISQAQVIESLNNRSPMEVLVAEVTKAFVMSG